MVLNQFRKRSYIDSSQLGAEMGLLQMPVSPPPLDGADKLHGKLREKLVTRRAHKSSWCTQMRAALRRNFSIKLRQKRRTLVEVLSPLYVFFLLAIIRSVIPASHLPALLSPSGSASLTEDISAVAPLAVFVAPAGPLQVDFAKRLLRRLTQLRYHSYVNVLPDVWLMEEYARAGNGTPAVGVLLPDDPRINRTYVLRAEQRLAVEAGTLEGSNDDCRSSTGSPIQLPASCPGNQMFFSGLLTLQNTIDSVILSIATMRDIAPADITIMNGPKPESDEVSTMVLRVFIPLYMVISLSHFVTYLLILVVGEKENKIKDCLKLMGLRDSVYWSSWFFVYAMQIVLVSLCCCLILKVSSMFVHSQLWLVLIFYILYGFSLILLAFMITPFFSKAKVAGGVGSLVVTVISLLYLFQVYLKALPRPFFWVMSLISPVAFTLGIDRMVELEVAGRGATLASLHQRDGGVAFYDSMLMLVVDIVVYALMAFYLDNVVPTEFGRRESPLFLFQRSYWQSRSQMKLSQERSVSRSTLLDPNSDCNINNSSSSSHHHLVDQQHVEPVSCQMRHKTALRVTQLSKVFSSGSGTPVTAVNKLTLDIYEGQITAILGHNGAGKTTFFNVITGLTKSTSGNATIYGLDINDAGHMREIWSVMGICPQQDILIDELTPRDHLRFISAIRNVAGEFIMHEVDRMLTDLSLQEKADDPVKSLSGGQKRKLSIGQALIGDPRVVVLDEPTAGLDPVSRRHIWSLLTRRKEGRVLLLSTHFMDEADVLADRKAVISSGQLRCCGSSMYLKKKFGLGYHLTVVLGESASPHQIDRLVVSQVPSREIGRRHGNELSFILPLESMAAFPELFSQLESQQTSLGVITFGLSLTSLEEVFLHLAERDIASDLTLTDVTRSLLRDRFRCTTADSAAAGAYDDHTPLPDTTTTSLSPSSHSPPPLAAAATALPAPPPPPAAAAAAGAATAPFIANRSHVHSSLSMWSRPPLVQLRPSTCRSLHALLLVRCRNFLRVRCNLVFTVLVPMVMFYVGLSLNGSSSSAQSSTTTTTTAAGGGGGAGGVGTSADAGGGVQSMGAGAHVPEQNISFLLGPGLYRRYDKVLFHTTGDAITNITLDTFLLGTGLRAERFNGSFVALLDHPTALAAVNITGLVSAPAAAAGGVGAAATAAAATAKLYVVLQDKAIFGASVLINAINNGLMRLMIGMDAQPSIETIFHPLPSSAPSAKFDMGIFSSGFFIGFLFLIFPSSIVFDLVKERELGIRNQLRVNGVGFVAYYLPLWSVHLAVFLWLWLFMLAMVWWMGVDTLSAPPALSMLAAVYFLYCFCATLSASMFAQLFSSLQMAQSVYPNLSNLGGMLSYVLVALFDLVNLGSGWGLRLHYIFSLANPFYTPCGVIYVISRKYLLEGVVKGRALSYADFWQDPVYLAPLLGQLVQIVVFWCLLVLLDRLRVYGVSWKLPVRLSRWLARLRACRRWCCACRRHVPLGYERSTNNSDSELAEDCDVSREAGRVQQLSQQLASGTSQQQLQLPVVVANQLCKQFSSSSSSSAAGGGGGDGRVTAVDRVSFAVESGEVFGLLGPNGAGKTSTMKMIIAEQQPDEGEIFIGGWRLHSKESRAFEQIGYCPQFDCLWPLITVEEHIRCWAAVRGVTDAEMSAVVQYYIDGLWLGPHATKPTGKCSGGTKRKLSYALSMLGRPRIVMLDEPSTGMDPQSKRFLWDTIAAAFVGDRGAVLTTHSMEEADALCTRLAILIRGRMRCLGSTQHLKNKYGGGYVLEVKIVPGLRLAERREQLESLVRGMFPSMVIDENYGEMVRFAIPQHEVTSLYRAFAEIQSAKDRLGIDDYNLSQTTLEQVFIGFAKQ